MLWQCLFLLYVTYTTYGYHFSSNTNEVEDTTNCLVGIISKITQAGDTIAIITDSGQEFPFGRSTKTPIGQRSYVRWSLVLDNTSSIVIPEFPEENRISLFLLQIGSNDQLKYFLDNVKETYLFNSRANFLVASTTKHHNETQAVSYMFKTLWSFNIYNGLIVLQSDEVASVFTWHPYGNNGCGKNFTNFKLVGRCLKGKLNQEKSLYPVKTPHRLARCPIRVRTVVWPPFVMKPVKKIANSDRYIFRGGFEIVLMNTMARAMNLNLTYTVSEKDLNWGEIFENGTATGLQAYVLENKADIGLSSQAYTGMKLTYFDMGEPYFYEHLVWCVPHADTVPVWKKILDVFSFESWILNLVTFLVFVASIWGFTKLNGFERSRFKSFFSCIESAFGVLLGVTVSCTPKSSFVRVAFSLWFIFTLHLSIVYKTTLISFLTSPIYQHQMSTVEEILESNTRLQFLSHMKEYFSQNQDHSKEILRKWIDCIDLSDCMDRVAYTGDSVILLPQLYLEFIQNRYKRRNRRSYIYCFNGNILTYPGSMMMRKGFPLRDAFNEYIRRMLASGLMDFWIRKSVKSLSSNKTTVFVGGEQKFISTKEMQPAFVCLGFGLMLATVAFVIENFVVRCRQGYINVYTN